jgi:glycosyltransferase involved in cell wall biosynthesis
MSLRVCYLLPRLLPGPSGALVGGCAVNCVSLASELQKQGAHVELLTAVSQGNLESLDDLPFTAHIKPLPEIGGGLSRRGLGAIRLLRRGLKETLQSNRFDVVHSHSGTFPYAILPFAADARTHVRLHSLYCPLGARGGLYSRWWDRPSIARALFDRLDRVIAVTENVRQSITNAGVRSEMVESVPMCVDTQRFLPRTPSDPARFFPAETNAIKLLFVGNSSREKGLIELLRAVRALLDNGTSVFLVAAVENQSEIREYAVGHQSARTLVRKLGLDAYVRWLGMVERIEDLYAESDILVIPWNTSRGPSDYPMVALEAMAMGKCIVATPLGGCAELLDHGRAGILAKGFSAEHLADALRFVVDDRETRTAMQQTALERAQNFSLRTSVSRLIELYERLLEEKKHAHATCHV